MRSTLAIGCLSGLMLAALSGCVERTVKIETDPPGALVYVNDEQVGVSPVKFSFLWYGDYDLIFRKPGYRTLKTHQVITAPWYQIPPIDLVAETVPWTIRDEHILPTFKLEQEPSPVVAEVVDRSLELRDRALFTD